MTRERLKELHVELDGLNARAQRRYRKHPDKVWDLWVDLASFARRVIDEAASEMAQREPLE